MQKKLKYLFHFIMTMEIVKNRKGGSKLCFEGYTYTKKSASKTTIHWECSQRKAHVCKGKVTTDFQVARVKRTVEHSHDANLERVEATKIIASMKESAGTMRAKPAICRPDSICYRSYPSGDRPPECCETYHPSREGLTPAIHYPTLR